MSQSRQLAAIMFTDIVGYTALMERNEQRAFQLLDENREVQRPLIEKFNGKWLKEMGDGILASFTTVSDAVYCACAIQSACENNPELSVRIGIHEGEVVFRDGDVFGSGVNIASRLESIAEVGGILVSGSVYRNIKNKEGIKAEFLKEETLKNVDEPIKIYQVKVERDEPPENAPTRLTRPPRLVGRKGVIVSALVIILLLLGYAGYQYRSNKPTANDPTDAAIEIDKSIAVLPFVNMSNDPDHQYFSDGVMEAILNDLTKIGELKVISRTSVMQYRDTKKTIPQIAEELGVAYLLEGGVQSFEGKVRINAQLINAKQDAHVWSENYDRQMTDIFDLQSEIAQRIASELNAILSPSEINELQVHGTNNSEAYDLYLMGRYFWYQRTGEALQKSVDYFEQSLVLDPEYALAYSGLADAYLILVAYGHLPQNIGYPKAKEHALKALEIEPNLAQAHATLGTIANREWRWVEAEARLKRSIELDPNYVMAHHWYAEYLFVFGPSDKLLHHINAGLKLDPFSFLMQSQLAWYYYNKGELGRAIEEYKTLLELDPLDLRGSHYGMFMVYFKQGKEEKAFNSLKKNWITHNYMEGQVQLAEDIYRRAGI